MIIKDPHLTTRLEIWAPKYHTKNGGYEVWLHKRKVDYATPQIIIKFTKAKHLEGLRFAILKQDAQSYPVGTNGEAEMYQVPLDKLEVWETGDEVASTAFSKFSN